MALIDTTHLDADTDKIKLARPSLKAIADFINGFIGIADSYLFTRSLRPWYKNDNAVTTTSTFSYDPTTMGQVCKVNLSNAITVTFGAPSNIVEGTMYKFMLTAATAHARTFGWNAAFKFPNATPTVTAGSSTLNAIDIITFIGGPSNTLIYDGKVTDVRQ